jgi:hypothetical protein
MSGPGKLRRIGWPERRRLAPYPRPVWSRPPGCSRLSRLANSAAHAAQLLKLGRAAPARRRPICCGSIARWLFGAGGTLPTVVVRNAHCSVGILLVHLQEYTIKKHSMVLIGNEPQNS